MYLRLQNTFLFVCGLIRNKGSFVIPAQQVENISLFIYNTYFRIFLSRRKKADVDVHENRFYIPDFLLYTYKIYYSNFFF